jgi:fumarate hydratase class I
MADILKKCKYPIKTRLKLNGTLIVARDIAHKIKKNY